MSAPTTVPAAAVAVRLSRQAAPKTAATAVPASARPSPGTVAPGSAGPKLAAAGSKATTGRAAGEARERGTGDSRSSAAGAGARGRTVALRTSPASSRTRSHLAAFSTSPNAANSSKGRALDALNARLNASLPAGTAVTYADREYTNDLTQALAEARAAYYQAAAPPQSVLDRALYVVRQGSNALDGHGSILYVLKKQRFFGIEICTGWKVENDGAAAIGGYTFGPCTGEKTTPPAGLPSLPPKAAGIMP